MESCRLRSSDEPEGSDAPPLYPKAVFFIVANEFCERFSFYGMRTILSLYLSNKLDLGEDAATTLYHTFSMFVYFFPLIGAIISDSWLGKFKTITYLSVVYMLGNLTLAMASLPYWSIILSQIASLVGLLLIAIGTGGIKPCVSSFGGDQFVLPQQEQQLRHFFFLFYFSINAGSLISTFITPIFRNDIHCFGESDCFPLAFGVPGVLMVLSLVIFVIGQPMYVTIPPCGDIGIRFVKCIGHAIKRKREIITDTDLAKEHWLDYADDEYDSELIEDIKTTLRIAILYIPLPVFWALYDQQGSRWTFQATHMKGETGPYTFKPDQFQVVNPLLILILTPLFGKIIYPALGKLGIMTKPLQRIGVGLVLCCAAFIVAGLVELGLEKTYVKMPKSGYGELRVYNGYMCDLKVTTNISNEKGTETSFTISQLDFYVHKDLEAKNSYNYKAEASCAKSPVTGTFAITSQEQSSYFFRDSIEVDKSEMVYFKDNTDKQKDGSPKIRILLNSQTKHQVKVSLGEKEEETFKIDSHNIFAMNKVLPNTYYLDVDDLSVSDFQVRLGGVYTVMLHPKESGSNEYNTKVLEVTEPNRVHIFWLIPQYFVMSVAEVAFAVTGMDFSYSQAPGSMKSVIASLWLLTNAFGNLIVVIIGEIKISDSQAIEFFVFAGMMAAATVVFIYLARGYKYVVPKCD